MDINELDYKQPSFYKFNEDSTTLVSYVLKEFSEVNDVKNCLDYCCGCGIIGLELSQKLSINDLCLFDIQKEYSNYLNSNVEKFSRAQVTNIYFDLDELNHTKRKFDLIVINPPYFKEGAGRLPSNKNRKRARFYKHLELKSIIENALSLCKVGGRVIFCLKEDENNIVEIDFLLNSNDLLIKKYISNKLSIFDITLIEDRVTSGTL